MNIEIFRKLSRNPENVKSICFDENGPFDFACRRWVIKQ